MTTTPPVDGSAGRPVEPTEQTALIEQSEVSEQSVASEQSAASEAARARRESAGLVARGGAWYLLGQLVPLMVSLGLTPFLVHGLGVERYGLFALATTITMFIGSFDGGIRSSAQRYIALNTGRDDDAATARLVLTLSLLVLAVGAVVVVVLVVGGGWLLRAFDVPPDLTSEGVFLLGALGFSVALGLLQGLYAAVLNAHHRYGFINLTRIVGYLGYAAGVVYAVSAGHGLRGLALAMVGYWALSTVLLVVAAVRCVGSLGRGLMPRPELREFLGYSARVQVTGLAGLVNLQADALVVAAFAPLASVGYYSVGATFASQLRTLPTNALSPVQSLLGRAYGRDETTARAEFERLQAMWVLGTTGLMAVGIGASWFGVLAWLGSEYRLAALVAVVLMAGNLVNLWTAVLTLWLGVVGRPELEAHYGLVSVALNIVLTVALAVPFGVPGVVTATAVAQVLGSLYLLRLVGRRLPGSTRSFLRDVPVGAALGALAVTVGVEFAGRSLYPEGPIGLLVTGLLALPGLACFGLLALGPQRMGALLRPLAARLLRPRRAPAPAPEPLAASLPAVPLVTVGER